VLVGIVIAVAYPVVTQADDFIRELPRILDNLFGTGGQLNFLETRFHVVERVASVTPEQVTKVVLGNQDTIVTAVTKAASLVAATITILTIMVMMLIEGPRAWQSILDVMIDDERTWAGRIGDNFLRSTGPNIIDLTVDELSQFDVGRIDPWSQYARTFPSQRAVDGARIPRLAELFALVREAGNEKVRFAIETKLTPQRPDQTPDPETFVRLLMKDVDDAGLAGRVQVLSFDWRTLQILRRDYPDVPTVYLTLQAKSLDNVMANSEVESPWNAGFTYRKHGSIPRMIKAAGGTHWSSNWRELNAGNIAEAKSLGLKVLAWTINDRQTMQAMLDMGVDGLVTDRPDIAIELLRDRKIGW
jgi:glycerophosphoryl diester phosphodiesterase